MCFISRPPQEKAQLINFLVAILKMAAIFKFLVAHDWFWKSVI